MNEPPAAEVVPSGHLPITDTRLRPDIRYLEQGQIEEAEAENKRLEDEQKRRLKQLNYRTPDGNNVWKPYWFT